MALEAQTIHSHYSPPVRPNIELLTSDASPDEVWRIETARADRRPPPRFVPAVLSYDEYGLVIGSQDALEETKKSTEDGEVQEIAINVGDWYRNLRKSLPDPDIQIIPNPNLRQHKSSTSSLNSLPSHPSSSKHSSRQNWFSSASVPVTPSPVVESIADLLQRNPPLKHEKPFRPPVHLGIGPSNKGYEMLSKSGWREGEGLGFRVGLGAKKRNVSSVLHSQSAPNLPNLSSSVPLKREHRDSDDETGFIDLTLSDSDHELDDSEDVVSSDEQSSGPTTLPSGGVSLLTPIPTTLKADRRGIGLGGSYITTPSGIRIPQRRVTHGKKALRGHLRQHEESQRRKEQFGRGSRGFDKIQKHDSQERTNLIAYMNS
ncbi:hypothetical protein SISSUDRAFT_1042651 [Sistotremastrum suecicum HHB10207 ss-3]|uniref:G-patch domain-containing protein n=1 Tax=Sistotremastrum suecicum HHB10207 ss-3 TaxID=1314776 RepID=A0A166GDI4_9AGAM|nr:hypothetical protein SISSUDRAFT_1042651 [Sistotremastrum suecicum HHB10207 ss-3]